MRIRLMAIGSCLAPAATACGGGDNGSEDEPVAAEPKATTGAARVGSLLESVCAGAKASVIGFTKTIDRESVSGGLTMA